MAAATVVNSWPRQSRDGTLVLLPGNSPYAQAHVVVAARAPRPQRPMPIAAGAIGGAVVGACIGGPVGAALGATVGAVSGSMRGMHPQPMQLAAAPLPEPPLAIAVALLPAIGVQQHRHVTFFAVDVFPEGAGGPWRVLRRYNEFLQLKHTLERITPGFSFPGVPFPRKHVLGCSGDKLEARRRKLELWLQHAIGCSRACNIWQRPLRNFLETGAMQVPYAPPAASPSRPVEPSPHTAPAASPATSCCASQPPPSCCSEGAGGMGGGGEAAAGAEAAPHGASGEMMQIEVPVGVLPGQYLSVTVPDGRQLLLMVPAGAAGGSQVQFWFDPAAATLTPMY